MRKYISIMTMRIVSRSLVCLSYIGYGLGLQAEDDLATVDVPSSALASVLVGLNSGALRPSRHISANSPSVKVKTPIPVGEGKNWRLSLPISLQGTKLKIPLTFIIKGVKTLQVTVPLSFLLRKVGLRFWKPTIDECEVQLRQPLISLKGRRVSCPIKFSWMGYEITLPVSIPDITSIRRVFDGRALSDFEVNDHHDVGVDLAEYKGKVVLVVDAYSLRKVSAYADLNRLQRKYGARGLQILVLADKANTLQDVKSAKGDKAGKGHQLGKGTADVDDDDIEKAFRKIREELQAAQTEWYSRFMQTAQQMYVYSSGPRFLDRKTASSFLHWLKEHGGSASQMFLIGRNGKTITGIGSGKSLKSVENIIDKKLRRLHSSDSDTSPH